MRDCGGEGRLPGAADRAVPRSCRHHPAQGTDTRLRAGLHGTRRRLGHGRGDQGCRRRSGCHAPGADHRHRATCAARSRRAVPRRRRRRHRDPARPADPPRRTGDQSRATRHDAHRDLRRGGEPWRQRRRGDRGLHPRRRGAGPAHLERSAGDRGRAVDPGHHRHCSPVFLRRLDRQHPSRRRCRPRLRHRTCRRRHRLHVGGGGDPPLRPGQFGDPGHGRLHRRHAEVPARPPAATPDHRGGLRQAGEVRARGQRPAFRAQPGGPGSPCRAGVGTRRIR